MIFLDQTIVKHIMGPNSTEMMCLTRLKFLFISSEFAFDFTLNTAFEYNFIIDDISRCFENFDYNYRYLIRPEPL